MYVISLTHFINCQTSGQTFSQGEEKEGRKGLETLAAFPCALLECSWNVNQLGTCDVGGVYQAILEFHRLYPNSTEAILTFHWVKNHMT